MTKTERHEQIIADLVRTYGYADSGEFGWDAIIDAAKAAGVRSPSRMPSALVRSGRLVERAELVGVEIDPGRPERRFRGFVIPAIPATERPVFAYWYSVPVPG